MHRPRIHAVVGTTGFTDEKYDVIRRQLDERADVGVLIAANFSIGAVLMMHFAEQAARFSTRAPRSSSSTTPARRTPLPVRPRPLLDGLRPPASLPVSAVAGRDGAGTAGRSGCVSRRHPGTRRATTGLVAHQEVLFGAEGETLTIRHDSLDRVSFMPGVIAAARAVSSRPGLTLGIDDILGL